MFGAVFQRELRSGRRRKWLHLFRWACAAFLLLPLVPMMQRVAGWWLAGPDMLAWLLFQQFLLVVLLTPAFSAGTLTDEKATGTLQLLLTTDLRTWEIVLGKWLARLVQAATPALVGLPVLAVLGSACELSPWALAGLTAVWLGPALGLSAASVLASVWCRSTTQAALAVYGAVAAGAFAVWAVGWPPGGALGCLDPRSVLVLLSEQSMDARLYI